MIVQIRNLMKQTIKPFSTEGFNFAARNCNHSLLLTKNINNMKKTYLFFVALAAMLFGAMNVSAEEVSLETVPFWAHETAWGKDATKNTPATPAWVIGESTGQPYGDASVNAFADLSGFDKLVITFSDGTPRVLLNRDQNEGQWNADEAQSHLIDNTRGGWSSKYFITEGNVMTVDLKQIANDKGFVHLHAIKGANSANVTVESMILTRKGKEKQVGWVNILTNSNMENDDITSFTTAQKAYDGDGGGTVDPTFEEGVGVNDSRALVLKTVTGTAPNGNEYPGWATQLFIKLPEQLAEGTKWRFSMDVKSDYVATFGGGCHAAPRDWKMGTILPEFTTSTDWQTLTAEGTISADFVNNGVMSLAMDLNNDKTVENTYYFDNIRFEVYKVGTTALIASNVAEIDFGFETNIAELAKAAGSRRVIFPNDCAKVLVNGNEIEIISVEAFDDGRFYIFFAEDIEGTDDVQIIFNNPAGELQLKYAGGPDAGQVVPDVEETADYDEDIIKEDAYPFVAVLPELKSAAPEQGSFNVAADLKELKVVFDKIVDAAQLQATLDGTNLTISPATDFATEFTLTYSGAALANGKHTVNITKIFPEIALDDEVYGDTTFVFSVGPVDVSDLPYDLIPIKYFTECGNNSIPEGYKLFADGMEERTPGNGYGSGSRLFNDFAAGGDFTSGLYIRRNYLTYGLNDEEHQLVMEAGKTYNLSFNTARWKASGQYLKVQLLLGEEILFEKVVSCDPDVNGSKNAVKGSSAYSIDFTPETTGNYELRFVVMKNAEEEAGDEGMYEALLANVKMTYIPQAFGAMDMYLVGEALTKAQKVSADYADARYEGTAQTTLNNTIAQVETDKDTFTSPSECTAAIEELSKVSEAMTSHALLCNNYDEKIKEGADVVRQNENPSNTGVPTKFVTLDLFAQLKAVVDKYHGVSVMQNDAAEGEPENWQKHYTFDELKDDAQLQTAINELTEVVNTTSKLFTTGTSQRNTTGVAALVERLRRGAEAIKVFEPENPIIEEALNSLDDNDDLAESVKLNLKNIVYGKMKQADNDMFTPGETGEGPTYDMSVFVKNPNLYALANSKEIPGWNNLVGNAASWSSWDGNVSHSERTPYAEDCCLHPGWHATAMTEQTITDLPAGVYNIYFNANDNSDSSNGTYVYAKLSNTPEVEADAEVDLDINYAGYAPVNNQGWDRWINNIVVTDGILTLGMAWGPESQAFLEDVKVMLAAPATGVDYNALYEEALTGVETTKATAKVRAIEIFDLSGKRIPVAKKGIAIVKKLMSDGTVRTEKVIK